MKMYRDYLKERLGDVLLERDEGFATYRFIGDAVYIVDIYVRPDFRRTMVASNMADEIAEIAKEKGCKEMIGTVSSMSKNPTDSIKVLLGYGMKFFSSTNEGLIFKKEI